MHRLGVLGLHPALTMRIPLTAFLLLASCASERPPAKIETPEGVIFARNDEVARTCLGYLREYQPQVSAIFDTNPERPVIEVRPWLVGVTLGNEIVVAELEGWNRYLVHELSHLHAKEHWSTLPDGIEEPLCELIALAIAEGYETVKVDAPTREQVELLLVVDQARWQRNIAELLAAGYWTVGQVGFERLRSLAKRADSTGRARIPPEWILECLPEVWEPVTIDLKTLVAFD